jgi:betaine lipid synthase
MAEFVNVPEFFSQVYLVDFSPSLCDVARKRFERLGWTNVRVVCEDARKFRLEDYDNDLQGDKAPTRSPALGYFAQKRAEHGRADLITMSYSLSMMVSRNSSGENTETVLTCSAGLFFGSRLDKLLVVPWRNYGRG